MFRAFARAHKIALDAHSRLQARAGGELAQRLLAKGAPPDQVLAGRGVWAKKTDTRGELYIYEGIGASFWGGGVTAKDVAAQLDTLKDVKTLDVYINSEGGDVFEGKAIYNLLKRFSATKTVHVDGIAASAASFIAMAGDKIVTAENATWMIHEASGFAMGGAGDMRSLADVLDGENKAIADMYAARTGQPASSYWARAEPSAAAPCPEATGMMADETWMSAEEALAAKLTDEIETNAGDDGEEADDAVAAKVPGLRIAAETQRRIATARARLVDAEHSVLQDRRRASPGRSSQRPAAPDPKRSPPSLRSA